MSTSKDGDFIHSTQNKAEAEEIAGRCNILIRHEGKEEELKAVVRYMVTGEDPHSGAKRFTYTIWLRRREAGT